MSPNYYRELLSRMPPVAEVEADAQKMYPNDSSLAACYAGGMFRGLYFFARELLESVLDNVERFGFPIPARDPDAVDLGGQATQQKPSQENQ